MNDDHAPEVHHGGVHDLAALAEELTADAAAPTPRGPVGRWSPSGRSG